MSIVGHVSEAWRGTANDNKLDENRDLDKPFHSDDLIMLSSNAGVYISM